MNMLNVYQLLITPLSPVHVGCGESYEPTNYVIEGGILYEFDTAAVTGTLDGADRKGLLELASRRPTTEMIQAVQKFFYERRWKLLAHALQHVPVLPGVTALYARRVGQTASREADGRKVINKLEIDRTAYNPVSRQPVLFGSSLKGAIRTALLDQVNAGRPAQESKGLHEFQGRLFRYYNRDNRHMHLERDPMRLVHVADAVWNGERGLYATHIRLAVNRKKSPVKDEQGRLRKSQAEAKDLYQILECLPAWHYRAFAGQLRVQSMTGLPKRLDGMVPAADLRFDVARIAQACNAFYRHLLEEETRQLRERGVLDPCWDKTLQTLLQKAEEKFTRGEAFLLRVGRHSGAESVTLNGVRRIRIIKGKDETPDYLPTAKTWWLAAEEKDQMHNLLPFGWLLVEVYPMQADVPEWNALKDVCTPSLEQARRLAEALQRKLAESAATHRKAEESRRMAEAERQRREEEERRKAQEAAARQAWLATLSPRMREVEDFKAKAQARKAQLGTGKEKANTGIHTLAHQLVKSALENPDWTVEEKRSLAEAIETWLPQLVERLDRKDDWKEARKKLKLAMLKGE